MRAKSFLGAVVLAMSCLCGSVWGEDYVPPRGEWARKAPAEAGFDPAALQEAIDFAIANETTLADGTTGIDARDLRLMVPLGFAREPYSSPIGPLKPRGAPTGIILRGGYIVAEWGEPDRVDMTFSITKTFLSHTAGVAFDEGLIPDTGAPVSDLVPTPEFTTAHNKVITWEQMLRQTSGWQGTLFGKPDWADRPGDNPWSDLAAGPRTPGAHWEYNDVRVNALALALLHVWRRPLPEVLREHVMDPIGASPSWRWHGYENSWVMIDGQKMQSVSGGGHWGGGMFISAYDLARLGLLGLRKGQWGETRILSERWFDKSLTPTATRKGYGYMNFFLLPRDDQEASERISRWRYLGSGTNMVYVDTDRDLVAVVRWIDNSKRDEFIDRLRAAVRP